MGIAGCDARGNVVEQIDPMNLVTKYEYDGMGLKTRETDPEGGVTKYEYDEATSRLIAVTDANGNRNELAYDGFGNVTSQKRSDGATWTFTFDANNNLLTKTDPNNTVTTYVYDTENRPTGYQISRGINVLGTSNVALTRDDLGRIVETSTDDGVKTFHAYDSLDRELRAELKIGAGAKRTLLKSYDPSGVVSGLTYPSGLALTITPDPLGRPALITQTGDANPIVRYDYLGGRVASKTTANGVVQTRAYDAYGRLIELLDRVNAAPLRHVQYERSAVGEKLKIKRPGVGTFDEFTLNRNSWIVAEDLNASLDVPNPQARIGIAYRPDAMLNYESITRIERKPEGDIPQVVAASINGRNQYTAVGGETLSYDRAGNLTGRSGITLQYDFEHHLARATRAGQTLDNLYDGLGNKVQETVRAGDGTSVTRQYVSDGGRVLEEYFADSLEARYVSGLNIDEIIRAEQFSAVDGTLVRVLYPVQDELGNVERLTDGSGATVERYTYEGYGKAAIFDAAGVSRSSSAVGWRWLFHGREYMPLLGAYDFRARTLWPDLRRFGQEDPLLRTGENPYAAFAGDWTTMRDPLGLEVDPDEYIPSRFIEPGYKPYWSPYNLVNGRKAHTEWSKWIRGRVISRKIAREQGFFTDRPISEIAKEAGIEPLNFKNGRPDAARVEQNNSVTLWELKPETYDTKRYPGNTLRHSLANAQLIRYSVALRGNTQRGFGSELNQEHDKKDFITVLAGRKRGYRMYAYSVSFDRGLIYYILEDQGEEKEKKSEFEKQVEEGMEFLDKFAGAAIGASGLGGGVRVPGTVPVP